MNDLREKLKALIKDIQLTLEQASNNGKTLASVNITECPEDLLKNSLIPWLNKEKYATYLVFSQEKEEFFPKTLYISLKNIKV